MKSPKSREQPTERIGTTIVELYYSLLFLELWKATDDWQVIVGCGWMYVIIIGHFGKNPVNTWILLRRSSLQRVPQGACAEAFKLSATRSFFSSFIDIGRAFDCSTSTWITLASLKAGHAKVWLLTHICESLITQKPEGLSGWPNPCESRTPSNLKMSEKLSASGHHYGTFQVSLTRILLFLAPPPQKKKRKTTFGQ